MKLLDWMQHKFRQTNNDPPSEFAPRNSCSCLPGQPALDHDLQYYPKSHYYAKTSSKQQREGQFRRSFTCIETAKKSTAAEEEEEESAAVFSELFHGFLAIGTLAAETVTNEPKTPTFSSYVENDMGILEPEETESEMKYMNDELEKVLEPEGKEKEAVVCPLQDYLFSSVIEMSETVTVKKEKEHRTSLGELFQKTKTVEEVTKINKTEKLKEKETEKSAVCLMKKILKGRTHYSSSKHSAADKKPRKILQMFHRKVHPERVAVEPKFENQLTHVSDGNFIEEYKNRNQMLSEDVKLYPMVDSFKKGANCSISHMPSECCMTDSDGNRECWINSDADYLVLEL